MLEGGAKPFGIGRVLPLHQEAQAHDVAHQSRANQGCANFVSNISGPPHQMLFLPDTRPTRRQQIQPYVVRVVGETIARGLQPDFIVKDCA